MVSTFESNAGTNKFNTVVDINANVDIDNGLTTITSTNTVIENGELNITSNGNIDAASVDIAGGELTTSSNVTINSTATTFTSNAVTNILNSNTDINANVDIDAALGRVHSLVDDMLDEPVRRTFHRHVVPFHEARSLAIFLAKRFGRLERLGVEIGADVGARPLALDIADKGGFRTHNVILRARSAAQNPHGRGRAPSADTRPSSERSDA